MSNAQTWIDSLKPTRLKPVVNLNLKLLCTWITLLKASNLTDSDAHWASRYQARNKYQKQNLPPNLKRTKHRRRLRQRKRRRRKRPSPSLLQGQQCLYPDGSYPSSGATIITLSTGRTSRSVQWKLSFPDCWNGNCPRTPRQGHLSRKTSVFSNPFLFHPNQAGDYPRRANAP